MFQISLAEVESFYIKFLPVMQGFLQALFSFLDVLYPQEKNP